MKRLTLLPVLILFISSISHAQSDKKVRTYAISKKTETVTEYDDGKEESTFVLQYEKYNKEGEWIEKVEYEDDGAIKKREVRKYDGNRIVEEILDEPQKSNYDHVRYTFDKDVLIKKEELNRDGEVKETKIYTYNKYGDLIEELKLDEDGDIDEKEVYVYDNRGLKIEKRTYNKSDELIEVKKYTYE